MESTSVAFLKQLVATPGPAPDEAAAARVWRTEANRFADRVWSDVRGNAYAVLEGGEPRVLLAGHIDFDGVLAVSFVFLALSCACAVLLGRYARQASGRADADQMDALIGGTSFAAFRLIVSRVPLRWLGLMMVLTGVGGDILYLQQDYTVRELFADDGLRAAYFARIDLLKRAKVTKSC